MLVLWAWYNDARYANPLVFGYEAEGFTTPIITGLYGLMLSIGRGIVIYSQPGSPCSCLLAWRPSTSCSSAPGTRSKAAGRGGRATYLANVFDPSRASLLNNWDRGVFLARFPQFVAVAAALWLALGVYQRRLLVSRDTHP